MGANQSHTVEAKWRETAAREATLTRHNPEQGQINTMKSSHNSGQGKPSTPYGKPSVAEVTHNSLSLSWQPPKLTNGGTIIAYMIEMCVLNGKDWVTLTKSCQGNYYKARNLQPNTSYQFRIRAENIYGRSKPGNISEIVQTSSFDVHDFSPSKEKKLTVRRSSTNTLVPVEGRVAAILNHSSPVIETTSVRSPEESRATLQREGFRSSLPSKKRSGSSLIPGTKTNTLVRLPPKTKFPNSHDLEIKKDGKGSNRNSIEDSEERVAGDSNIDSDARSDLGSECNTLSQSSGSEFLGKEHHSDGGPDIEDEPDGDHRVSEDMMLSAPVCDVKLALYSRTLESYSDEKLRFLSDEGIDTSGPVNPDFRTLRSMLQSSDVIIKPTQSLPEISDVCRGKDGRGSLRNKLTPIVDEEDDDSVQVTTL
ncbi:uncharacterized protein LOC124264100 [Haliotis rubra]|uniref:uncharacterized protein LOC124264100 n=1 Tax=Haliotis rubra TaxID=36100 RepID=UPI001EE57CC5|nr:uncharacterized protein LOC124264100 [Haliotis rubra]